ncbi:hypothetical protein [Desulfovirgula thermocuniculi]|uniref:hypothetical protein n=1 Tax=Desulfovirgula thermocuniculi TaxID=348842 RepID=UPI0004204593|nr:hypothetical protein [Desulfovirgula thermocuniculi]
MGRKPGKPAARCYTVLACLVLVVSLALLGAGMASWREGIELRGAVATGYIDVAFTGCTVAGESAAPSRAGAYPDDGGKRLLIFIRDAYPGYYAHLRYRLTNLGTIPVRCAARAAQVPPGLEVEIAQPDEATYRPGESREGDLYITVGAVQEEATYDFSLVLVFTQWNAGQ